MANKAKGGGNNLTRQHYQLATGQKVTGTTQANNAPAKFVKGAKVASKNGKA